MRKAVCFSVVKKIEWEELARSLLYFIFSSDHLVSPTKAVEEAKCKHTLYKKKRRNPT